MCKLSGKVQNTTYDLEMMKDKPKKVMLTLQFGDYIEKYENEIQYLKNMSLIKMRVKKMYYNHFDNEMLIYGMDFPEYNPFSNGKTYLNFFWLIGNKLEKLDKKDIEKITKLIEEIETIIIKKDE